MVNGIVAAGTAIVDMDIFEAPGFRHYRGASVADDKELRELYVDRIYDTCIGEEQLQACDGACSSSTFKEAFSRGKVDMTCEQMVYAEATSVLPLIAGYAYHGRFREDRAQRRWSKVFEPVPAGEPE